MKEELISFETAKLARVCGFNISTEEIYDINGKILYTHPCESFYGLNYLENKDSEFLDNNFPKTLNYNSKTEHIIICFAPTQSLLQRWLREEHNIHFWVYPKKVKKGQVCFDFIFIDAENPFVPTHFYKTYEEALEEGLKEALIIIKEGK